MSPTAFSWQDGERLIRFGPGCLAESEDLLGDGFTLLTTERALAAAPHLGDRAAAVHRVPPGRVDEVAGGLRAAVEGERLVALGGGRVIDVAKALAAADPPRRVAAIPTTLSAAEMTPLHRHAAGVPDHTARVRPDLVVNDPRLSASQPEPDLAASALNSLAHAAEAPLTPLASPVPTLAALEGGRLIAAGLAPGRLDRDQVALGSLLAGYAAGASVFGLHHVMAQTIVRLTAIDHAPANAILLPHTLGALARRFPADMERFAAAVGGDPAAVAAGILARTGALRLRDAGVGADELAPCAEAAERRTELSLTPPPARREELLDLYEAAW